MKNKTKGIELVLQITNDLRFYKFDCFEVHPCKVVDGEAEFPTIKQCVEQCEREEAEFWSVYVHLTGGGLDCIADCETEELANQLVEFLKALCVNYKPAE